MFYICFYLYFIKYNLKCESHAFLSYIFLYCYEYSDYFIFFSLCSLIKAWDVKRVLFYYNEYHVKQRNNDSGKIISHWILKIGNIVLSFESWNDKTENGLRTKEMYNRFVFHVDLIFSAHIYKIILKVFHIILFYLKSTRYYSFLMVFLGLLFVYIFGNFPEP